MRRNEIQDYPDSEVHHRVTRCRLAGYVASSPARAPNIDFFIHPYQNEIMRLIGQDVLSKAIRRHADARKWLQAWIATVEDAAWESLDDIRADYPSADGVKLKSRVVVTVFNVKGNEYRLLTNVNYDNQVVLVLELLSHADYDKDRWKGRY